MIKYKEAKATYYTDVDLVCFMISVSECTGGSGKRASASETIDGDYPSILSFLLAELPCVKRANGAPWVRRSGNPNVYIILQPIDSDQNMVSADQYHMTLSRAQV